MVRRHYIDNLVTSSFNKPRNITITVCRSLSGGIQLTDPAAVPGGPLMVLAPRPRRSCLRMVRAADVVTSLINSDARRSVDARWAPILTNRT